MQSLLGIILLLGGITEFGLRGGMGVGQAEAGRGEGEEERKEVVGSGGLGDIISEFLIIISIKPDLRDSYDPSVFCFFWCQLSPDFHSHFCSFLNEIALLRLTTTLLPAENFNTSSSSSIALESLKKSCVRLVGILAWQDKTAQDEIRELGGLNLLLGMCQINDLNPSAFPLSCFLMEGFKLMLFVCGLFKL